MGQKRTEEEVEELLQRYYQRGSGITRRGFCEAEGISLSMLDYYLRRRHTNGVGLARVEIQEQAMGSGGRYALLLGNGRRIECGAAELAQLIEAAERA